MSKKWDIKGVRNNETVTVATVHELEYHGEWMAEAYVTVTVKSPTPIDWHFDDYLEYRGELFSINYDPNVVKKARRGTYDEGFTYENIKFYFLGNKAKSYGFKDVVLYQDELENTQTYTSLATFQFFCSSIEDFADRLQANFDREQQSPLIEDTPFRVLTPSYVRTLQRCPDVTQEEWLQYFDSHDESQEIYIAGETDINIEIDRQNCFDVMKNAYEKFGLSYFVKGTMVIIGGKALRVNSGAQNIFRYGKGLGLYEIERTSDDQQEVFTKLFAYGSEQNLPLNYYANLGKIMYLPGNRATKTVNEQTVYGLNTAVVYYAIQPALKNGGLITIKYGNLSVNATVETYTTQTGEYVWVAFINDGLGSDQTFYNSLGDSTALVDVVGGANINQWPAALIREDEQYQYPNALSINKLMLPGFPKMSLYTWVSSNHPELLERYEFSTDAYDPWIKSKHIYDIGLFEGAVNFDGSQQKEIYPTINNTGAGVVTQPSVITDNGYLSKEENFTIEVADDALNWKEALDNALEEVKISMTSGYCTGREFKVQKAEKNATDDAWVLTLARSLDSSLSRYFPYHDSYESGYCQIRVGDTFAVIGIQIPDEYIEAASEKLLIAACGYLDKRDHIRYTYLPKIDHLFMQRDADKNGASSYHDKMFAGMVLEFEDSDLGIWHTPYIDQLTIKEDGEEGIPTYDVVLRDEKEKGALEKLTETIEELMANPPTQVVERQQRVLQYVEYPEWDPNALYYSETLNTETDVLETSMVWHKGKKWMCLRTFTHEEPGLGCQDWKCVEGDTHFYLDFAEDYQLYDPDNFNGTLTIVAKWGTEDVTSMILQDDIVWTRYTEDPHGQPRTASDAIWDTNHEYSAWQTNRERLVLHQSDLDAETEFPSLVRFRCDVTLRDGQGDEIVNDYVEMEYNSNT